MIGLPTRRFLLRLGIIYVLDWAVILGTIIFAGTTSIWAVPNARPFSPTDPSIAFPFQTAPKIPSWLLIVLSCIFPVVAILLLTTFLSRVTWNRRLYNLNSAWLGLGLAIATAMLVTNGLKNLIGRPRPDLLARCDVDPRRINESLIGPAGLLDWRVCINRDFPKGSMGGLDESDVKDGFRSFPSGHSSTSFAGLTYLALFLAEFVFALPLPYVSAPTSAHIADAPVEDGAGDGGVEGGRAGVKKLGVKGETPLPRFPVMLAVLVCSVPVLVAAYISSTRFSDFRHHGFDILFGGVLGIGAAMLGWRWYGAWCCVKSLYGGRVRGEVKVADV